MEEKKILNNDSCPHKRVEIVKTGECDSVYRGKSIPVYKYRLDCYDDEVRLDNPIVEISFESESVLEQLYASERFKKSYVNQILERFWGDYQQLSCSEFLEKDRSGNTLATENDASVEIEFGSNLKCIISQKVLVEELIYFKLVEKKDGKGIGIALGTGREKIKDLLEIGNDCEKIEECLREHIIHAILFANKLFVCVERDKEGGYIEKVYLENFNIDTVLESAKSISNIERFAINISDIEYSQIYKFVVYEDGKWVLKK
jgi:hypothetical protein